MVVTNSNPVLDFTYSLHCSSFLGLPYRILIIYLVKPKKGTTMETTGKVLQRKTHDGMQHLFQQSSKPKKRGTRNPHTSPARNPVPNIGSSSGRTLGSSSLRGASFFRRSCRLCRKGLRTGCVWMEKALDPKP